MRTWAVAIVVVAMGSGCKYGPYEFACTDDASCGAGGKCEPGFHLCSFTNPSCPSGRAFGDLGGANAGQCVGSQPLPDGGSPDGPPDAPQSCSAELACPAGTGGKQTICGQLYDFETGQPFAQAGAAGAPCDPGATSGPCALVIKAFDAVAFAQSGGTGGALTTGTVYIDDCGRFRIPDVSQPVTASVIVLGIDDVAQPGPTGITNAAGVSTAAVPNSATKDVEAFIVKPATTAGWSGPSLAAGIFALVYHGKLTGTELASGVTATRNGAPDATHTYYFAAGAANRTALDGAARVTGMNGTALYTITSPMLTDVYSGTGALPSGCNWEAHLAVAIQGLVFIQTFRPTGATCPP